MVLTTQPREDLVIVVYTPENNIDLSSRYVKDFGP